MEKPLLPKFSKLTVNDLDLLESIINIHTGSKATTFDIMDEIEVTFNGTEPQKNPYYSPDDTYDPDSK